MTNNSMTMKSDFEGSEYSSNLNNKRLLYYQIAYTSERVSQWNWFAAIYD